MKKYLFLLLILVVSSCELVVDVDIPLEKNKLVVNSLFNPDSTWKARVSLSRHILDEAPFSYVENAQLVVFEGETAIDTLKFDSLGYYRSANGRPVAGKDYSIRASAPGYDEALAFSSCPKDLQAEFSAIQSTVGEDGRPEYAFTINLQDSPGQDFYQVMAIAEYRYTNPYTGQGFVNRSNVQLWSDDEGIDDDEIANFEGFFFPDVLFDGKNFSINAKMQPNMWGGNAKLKYYIYFRSVSQDYYKYKTTSLLQNYTSGDPFAQPVNVYTNIENGLGVFAGFTQKVVVLEL